MFRAVLRAFLTMPLVFQMKEPSGPSHTAGEQQSWLEGRQSSVHCFSYPLLFLSPCWGPSPCGAPHLMTAPELGGRP